MTKLVKMRYFLISIIVYRTQTYNLMIQLLIIFTSKEFLMSAGAHEGIRPVALANWLS